MHIANACFVCDRAELSADGLAKGIIFFLEEENLL